MDSSRTRIEKQILDAMDAAGRDVMVWGADDCALWCANIIREVLPYDPAESFRGRYTTRLGAARALGKTKLKGAIKRTARRHGWKPVHPSLALPGDIGLVSVNGVLATVICRARGWFVGRNERGFTVIPARDVVMCWSILNDNVHAGSRIPPRTNWRHDSVVPCEPVSTGIGLTALISSLGVSAAAAGAIGGAIVSGVLSIGLSLASSLIQSQRDGQVDPTLSNANNVLGHQLTQRQPIPIKQVVVGRAYVGGKIFFEEAKAPYLYIGTMFHDGALDAVESLNIGTWPVQFATINEGSILTPLAATEGPDYATYFQACFRYGASGQTRDALIDSGFSSVGTEFRQRGISTAVYRFHFGGTDKTADTQAKFIELWGQTARPSCYLTVRGARVYDPRKPAQSLADESTWEWSNNATLVQAWYLTRSWGGRIPTSKVRWDLIAEAADYDDEPIGCEDGTFIPRHTIDGVITLNQRPHEVMRKLLTANRGVLLESGGEIWIESSKPKDPVFTIHDKILVGGISYQSARLKGELTNKLQVRFVSPDQEYQLVDGPILSRSDLQTADGEVLPGTLALEYTQDHRRAQRLQKAFLDSSRLGRTLTCTVDLSLLATVKGRLINAVGTINSELFPATNGQYRVTAVGFSDDLTTLSLALTEYDSSIETSYRHSVDEQEFTLSEIDVD